MDNLQTLYRSEGYQKVSEKKRKNATSEICIKNKSLALLLTSWGHDACLLVLAYALLKEIGLALQGDELHPIERIGGVVKLGVTKGSEQPVCNKLNVPLHQITVHANQVA